MLAVPGSNRQDPTLALMGASSRSIKKDHRCHNFSSPGFHSCLATQAPLQPLSPTAIMTNKQPQAHGGMSVRNVKNVPYDKSGEREWSHGLCSCLAGPGTCTSLFLYCPHCRQLLIPFKGCCACFCPCVIYGKNRERLAHLESKGTPLPGGGSCCTGNCCLHACLNVLLGLGCILQVRAFPDRLAGAILNSHQIGSRGNVRSRYKISGGCCSDCCSSMCCGPCALTQESREIELEEDALKVGVHLYMSFGRSLTRPQR